MFKQIGTKHETDAAVCQPDDGKYRMPTVLDSLNVAIPSGVQGQSFRALLRGKAGARGKETIWVDDRDSPELLETDVNDIGLKSFRVMALRSRDFKLVYYPGQPWGELYNLGNDPDEFENLWGQPHYRKTRNELQGQLLARVVDGDDPLPVRGYMW